MKNKVLWIAQTGILIALLIVSQFATSFLNNTLITGSIVNLILIVSVMTCGLSTGICVATLSPIFAKLVGIGPFWSIIPFIILGNLALILVWHFINEKLKGKTIVKMTISCVVGAVIKYLLIFITVVKIAVPLILKLPEPKATAISAAFSVPQLITALIGGFVAILLVPTLQKAIKNYSEK